MPKENFRKKMPVEKLTRRRDELSLFCTHTGRGSDLKKMYPELAKEKEFEGISPNDLKFAWYYAVHFANAREPARTNKSIQFGYFNAIDPGEERKLRNGNFSDKIKRAIAKFRTYDLDARREATLIAQVSLYNDRKILDIDIDELVDEEGKRDWDSLKKYVDIKRTILNDLPEKIALVESGFGVRETKYEKKEVTEKLIDNFHDKNQ